jgi:ubiquinone biosynthesis protein
MSTTLSQLARLPGLVLRACQIGAVITGHGLVLGAATAAGRLRGAPVGSGDRWVKMLTALGPSYIKIGQLLSTRRDLLPDEVCAELARLTDATAPPSRKRIENAVRGAYRGRDWPFAEFDWTPVACGSIATVHRAVTADGRQVAVKVRRPGIDTIMRRDFELTSLMMAGLGALPPLRSMPMKVMFSQVGGAILRQLDFAAERDSLHALRANLRDSDGISIPAPLAELCTDEIVVMDYIDDLVRFAPGDLSATARGTAARKVMRLIYEMLFVDGLVHCDLHPGNLYLTRDTRLVILDAGFVIRLPESVRMSFADFFINMSMGNGELCGQIVIESAAQIAPGADRAGFRGELAQLITETTGMRSGDFSLARFAGRLFDLQRRYGMYPAPEFAFPLLSLLVLEGMVKGFDPGLDFQAEAVPILKRRNLGRGVVSRDSSPHSIEETV